MTASERIREARSNETRNTTNSAVNGTQQIRERLIARRVRGGFTEQDSAALLDELLRTVSETNLPAALAYQGFTR